MSHQGEDGWYPECGVCDSGNLGGVVCMGCYNKLVAERKEILRKYHSLQKRFSEAR